MDGKILYIVVPCYNEEEVLPQTADILGKKIRSLISASFIDKKSRILFVNDGSKDRTWQVISDLHKSDRVFSGVNLTRNRGHQNALLAGLTVASDRADIIVSMDADLQDDVNALDGMITKYYEGCEIVYGVRNRRDKDSFFKRFTAEFFYKVMKSLGAEIVFNHADYRLMSKRAVRNLLEFNEVNLFLRGIVPMIGYNTGYVFYERGERAAGETKYPLRKMLSFAMEGVTSISVRPLRIISVTGFFVFMVSIAILIYSIYRHHTGNTIIGWASIAVSIWAIGGLMLLSIGVVGEYVGKIYLETKHRPKFIIESVKDDLL